jgi:epoxyqueuosine reductase
VIPKAIIVTGSRNALADPIDPDELTRKVKREARRLGFDLVGVTGPDPPPHFDVFQAWLEADRHGEMAYLASLRACERRAEPRKIMPECESILVVAANCRGERERPIGRRAKIATYARGQDYHAVLIERLESLASFIRSLTGLDDLAYRLYTDTGPLLERELAQRAGLGWIGKNTCLINPERGSHFLLAEVLLGIKLVPDQPFTADRCGACTRCIQACPTSCIMPDRTLDASRCISYLTIETKGAMPEELRPHIGDWIFGCDVCQDVCPWNVRFSKPTTDPAFLPTAALQHIRPEDFLRLEPADWKHGLRRTALVRPGRRGLVRNAAVVAGNQRSLEDVEALATVVLDDPDPIARSHAAWALGQIGGPQSRSALIRARSSERDPQVTAEIESALQRLDGGAEETW